MKFEELFEGIPYRHAQESNRKTDSLDLCRLTTSSGDADEKTVYVVSKTALEDGVHGVSAAYAAGCRVFLCEHELFPGEDATVLITQDPKRYLGELAARVTGHPGRSMTVVGITGTHGKTSVVMLLLQILRKNGYACAAMTSDGIFLEHRSVPRFPRVPDAAEIQVILQEMAACGTEIAVLELSSYQLSQYAASAIPFTAVLLTDFAPRHIGPREHADILSYRAAKQALLQCPAAVALLPVGCEWQTAAKRVLFFGEGGELSVEQSKRVKTLGWKYEEHFLLCEGENTQAVTLPLLGNAAVKNALAAAALARVLGVELKEIADALRNARVRGRMECAAAGKGRLVYIDSAYEPEDLKHALCSLREITEGRLSVLFGSVGGRAKERRAELGKVAQSYADFIYLTADDPDAEDPVQICAEILEGITERERTCVLPDRARAMERAVRELRPFDVLLLAGKGADEFQLIGGVRQAFCEKQILDKLFSAL